MNFTRRTSGRRGFTLTEMVVATAVFGVIMGAVMSFLLSSKNFSSYNQGKLLINRDIRKFTSELGDYATYSSFFIIYNSFKNRVEMNEGQSGDFLLLAFVDETDPSAYTALVGYYRSASTTTAGPVRKFAIKFDPPRSEDIEDLIPATSSEGTHPEVIELSRGLSDGQLFYNFFGRSITVQGEILHKGSNLKQATNTYNFTVSPRG
ncbi:type II secretion system protein [Pelagicoccus mobilis]|uniref:Type II secretion system protein n=1 Tax=Pelagicoccus mobilis TaxID=415221 RepID=A0A934VSG0_9BACT|nr:type II secretion system protein [Pelagicoccus mobilis]MBK1880387.1 type II secretion system protein [Pelagicoccus mobilis]